VSNHNTHPVTPPPLLGRGSRCPSLRILSCAQLRGAGWGRVCLDTLVHTPTTPPPPLLGLRVHRNHVCCLMTPPPHSIPEIYFLWKVALAIHLFIHASRIFGMHVCLFLALRLFTLCTGSQATLYSSSSSLFTVLS